MVDSGAYKKNGDADTYRGSVHPPSRLHGIKGVAESASSRQHSPSPIHSSALPFSSSPAPSPPLPTHQQQRTTSPSLSADGAQMFLEAYLAQQQSQIMMYQQSLMNDMSKQMSG